MDLLEIKKYHTFLVRLILYISLVALAYPVSLFIINGLQLNLYNIVGFPNITTDFIIFVAGIAIILICVYELIIMLIFLYLKATRMFFPQQKKEVKFVLRIAFTARTLILAGIYILAMYFHPIFNYIPVFELIANFVCAIIFYFICKREFGEYAIAAYLFKQTARLFFLIEIISLIINIGGMLI